MFSGRDFQSGVRMSKPSRDLPAARLLENGPWLADRVRRLSKHPVTAFQRQSVKPLGPGRISFRLQHLG
jgi:hypothetical protein